MQISCRYKNLGMYKRTDEENDMVYFFNQTENKLIQFLSPICRRYRSTYDKC